MQVSKGQRGQLARAIGAVLTLPASAALQTVQASRDMHQEAQATLAHSA